MQWDGDDLSKAPPAWSNDRDIPEFVKGYILAVIDGAAWDKFTGYSRQASKAIRNEIEQSLTQPQGFSISSIVDRMQKLYPGLADDKAANIARTEVHSIMNSAREEAYKDQDGAENFVYYWQGPADHRETLVCREIKRTVEKRGGSVPLEELRGILRSKAKKYEGTREGGTPERVDSWTPHHQCRHTFIRDVRASFR